MFLGTLIDAGVPVDKLFAELKKLTLGFYEFKRTRAVRGGLVGTRVEIRVPGDQPHRTLTDILVLIDKASLPTNATGHAMKIFKHLAEVEGKLHNVSPGEVHFHEVGAVDSIIDIVGTCVALDLLEISELICSPLNVGGGRVEAAHGSLPVPAPATAELLKDIPVYSSGVEGELVTPTGAALVANLASSFGPFPSMMIARIGYGAGEKELPGHPNLARILIGESVEGAAAHPGLPGDEVVSIIEASLPGMTPQAYGEFLAQAIAAGALDVSASATQSKTDRPGHLVSVVCDPAKSDELSQFLFEKTAARGLRIYEARRKTSDREAPPEPPPAPDDSVSVIEANVDDMSPQLYGYFLEQALAAGALDVTCTSAQMKKNRPGLTISLICDPARADALSGLIFEQTTTIGLRIFAAKRKVLARERVTVETPYGAVQIKVAKHDGKVMNAAPEFDDCQRLAAQKSVPLKQVIAAAEAAYLKQSGS